MSESAVSAAVEVQAEKLREVLSYDPLTGAFTRLLKWGRQVCEPTGAVNGVGYVTITFDGKRHAAHRLAWLYVHGRWPVGELDHINGVRTDNRIANLRDVNRSQNNQNRRPTSSNRSGLLGVYWHSQKNKWRAQIEVEGKAKHLGLFSTKEAAREAYEAAKRIVHPYWAGGACVR